MNKDNVEEILKQLGTEDVPADVLEIAEQTSRDFEKTLTQIKQSKLIILKEYLMKTKLTKLAAAAVIVTAVTVSIFHFGGPLTATVTFADVVKPILNARTASLDIIIGGQGNQAVIHDDVMGSRIKRTVSGAEGADIIIDFEQQRMLALDHTKKTAVYIGLGGLPDLKNYVELLQNLIIRLQEKPDLKVENQGTQNIDGRDCLTFVAQIESETITIWADAETTLPIRIEEKTPNMQIVCDNLQFDVDFDESLFSMEVPKGYTIQDAGGIDFSQSSESAFIETLRIWAEIIEDRQFPDSINLEDIVKLGPKFDQGMKRAGLTDQEKIDVATKWGQGLVFIRFFKGQGQWHYAGAGVKLGDGDTPIFWYQPQGSETWRVIYGDLSVKDVAPEDLPQ
jgi:hypothetical protein